MRSDQNNPGPVGQRSENIDVAKGILILAVVLGHAPSHDLEHILYWFHIPAFFFISGLLVYGKKYDVAKILDRTKKLLIPYLSFGIAISIYTCSVIWYTLKEIDIHLLMAYFLDLIRGGRTLKGSFGVFWFVNALIVINVLFFILQKARIYIVVLILVAFYIGSHLLSAAYGENTPDVIWSVDSAMLCMVFFCLGYYSNSLIKYCSDHTAGIIMLVVGSLFIFLQIKGIVNLDINIKYLYLRNWILDLFVPLLFTGIVLYIASVIVKFPGSKVLIYIGMNTQIIMYMHLVSNRFINLFVKTPYHYTLFLLLGIIIPLITLQIINQSALLKKLFLGKF
jgi:fucose 4-O-acetylase-like acetyltransferase